MINGNENKTENEKTLQRYDIAIDMDINIPNVKCVSV